MKHRVPVVYNDADTFFHRRDPRVKIAMLFVLGFYIYVAPSWQWMLAGGLAMLGLVAVARVPPKWIGILLLFQIPNVVTYLAFPAVARMLAGRPPLSGNFDFVLKVILSWQVALFLGAVVFTTMRLTEITDGLRGLGVPEVAAFTVEYVFLLFYLTFSDLWRIVDATTIKGARLETKNPITLIRNIHKVFVPMVITVLRRANTMMAVLKMRGYSFHDHGELRTDLKFDAGDAAVLVAAVLVVGFTAAVEFGWIAVPWLPYTA